MDTNTAKVQEVFQQHFKPLPLSMDDDRLIYETVQSYGEVKTLAVMRKLYKRGATNLNSFKYIKRAVENEIAAQKNSKEPAVLQNGEFKSDAQKAEEARRLLEGVARTRRALSIKNFLSGKARDKVGKETIRAVDAWVKHGGKRAEEAIRELEGVNAV